MKQVIRNLSLLTLGLALMIPASLLAQVDEKVKEEKEKKEKKEIEQIVITRKGDKNEKMVIEINGDKVIVNGKEIDKNAKEGDVTVRTMKLKEISALARVPGVGNWNMQGDGFSMFTEDANRAMLGVVTEKTEEGLEIQDITKESAAEKAGLKVGDYITKVNDKKVESPDQLSEVIKSHKPGDKVTVTYLRDKKEQKVTAELTKWKGVNAWTMPKGDFKMDMKDLEKYMPKNHTMPKVPGQNWSWSGGGPKMGLSIQDTDDGKGVKVIQVDEESNAAKAGMKEGDIVTEVDGKAVNTVDEMAKIIRESKEKKSVMMKVQRGGKTQNVEVSIPRRIKTTDI